MEKIGAVVFDLDGTLANTLPLCIKAFRCAVEPLIDRTLSDEEIIATFGPSEEGTIMALAPDHYEQGMAAYLYHYEKLHGMCRAVFAGMESILKKLQEQGIRIAMVTGKGRRSTDISLKYLGLASYFELVETGSPAGPKKAIGIDAILNQLSGVNREEVIYVGDAPSDIIASKENGIKVIAAAWAETAEPAKLIPLSPDEIFYSVQDFANWLYSKI